jgi:glycosyltransferase involved in cell wall biosynthesis
MSNHSDVLVVALESTPGWRAATRELVASLERAGARVAVEGTGRTPRVRTFALTDLVEAQAGRRACRRGIERHDAKAVIYCSITTALLWPRPGSIWLDATATENRPGRHGIWQRQVERRRLRQAPMILAMSPGALGPLSTLRDADAVVPVPVEPSDHKATERDIAAITYAADPEKRRLHHVLEAWGQARRDGETLVVAGLDGLEAGPGVDVAGRLDPDEYRNLLRRAKAFIAAPRREDYGIAPLEALADGCLLVTTPAPGAYPARDIAAQLDPRLVQDDLAQAIRTALDEPRPGYAEQAAHLLRPFTRAALDQTVAQRVLPRLLSQR